MTFVDWLYVPPNLGEYNEMIEEQGGVKAPLPELIDKLQMVRGIAAVMKQWESDIKTAMMEQMTEEDLTSYGNDAITATIVPETVAKIVDTTKLKSCYKDVYEDCLKDQKRAASIRVTEVKTDD